MELKNISYQVVDGHALVGFGVGAENSMVVLSRETLQELESVVTLIESEQDQIKGAVFFSHSGRCFLAGADIFMIDSFSSEEEAMQGSEYGQQIFNRIEDLSCPTAACINGVCLGGGLELVLSCNYILVSDSSSTQLGLPEVKLGLLPGLGGTYRLPKRVGLPVALDLILSGKSWRSKKCFKGGLADGVFPKERLLEQAIKMFTQRPGSKGIEDRLKGFATNNIVSSRIIFKKARDSVLQKTRGLYRAPLKILDHLENTGGGNREYCLSSESRAFGELCFSSQSRNLRHVFFLTEKIKKAPSSSSSSVRGLNRGAVIGAGTMGGGIAWLMATNEMFPIMKDVGAQGLELGLKQASRNLKGSLKRRHITAEQFERCMRSISPQTDYRGFDAMELVVEAIVEDMGIKKKVLSEVEGQVGDDCIITTNTSSLSVSEMAGALRRPHNFAGLHFFNPVNRMPLVEIITHNTSGGVSEETVSALYSWCLRVGKFPVVVGDGPGFLVNRVLMPFLNEAGVLLQEGVPPQLIEDAALNFGMPMGPLLLLDQIGIDVGAKVAAVLHEGLGERARACDIMGSMVEQGLLGKKSGKGFYLHSGKKPVINPDLRKILGATGGARGGDEDEIVKRLIYPMINEAAMTLQDKIVQTPEQVDSGLIFGIGFPPFRGGALRYADSVGLDKIVDALNSMREKIGPDRYTPCDYITSLVSSGNKFYSSEQ